MTKVGISAFGSYIPYLRLDRGVISKIWGETVHRR